MNSPAISVIVPIYNVKDYLQECIDSILAQTFQDIELILVDDASTDGSWELCRKLYAQQPLVKLIERDPPSNQGLSRTRNLGLRFARGEYVTFVDSDDYLAPDCLAKLYAAAAARQADVVAAGFCIAQENEEKLVRFTRRPVQLPGPKQRLRLFVERRLGVQAWGKLYRRDFLQLYGLEFQDIRSEDELFAFLVFWHAGSYILLPDILYYYRQTPRSIMRGQYPGKVRCMVASSIRVMRCLEEYLQDMPELLADAQLVHDVKKIFLARFAYDTSEVCAAYGENGWQAEAWEALREFFGKDALWIGFSYISMLEMDIRKLEKR